MCNLRGNRWIAGRVVHTDCRMMSDDPGHEPLLYFYRFGFCDPSELRPPFRPDLLIPPVVTDFGGWQYGYFQTVGNYPMLPEERLSRHCFLRGRRGTWDSPDAVYVDEYGNRCPRPNRGEYWDTVGLSGVFLIDNILSDAIGISQVSQKEFEVSLERSPSCGSDEVIIYIMDAVGDSISLAVNIENPLAEEVSQSAVGRFAGHGYDIERQRWDIRFNGPDPNRIAKVLLSVLKRLGLPPGSFMLVGGRRSRRIDL